ncbi:MAG: DUF2141 domain-containing protein [Pseudomonas sp.]|uniref:DUF2141 domain-containing protein n=1 Tax=Pseudomonas sp. TaxID=306 RepID=UPI003394EE7D
MALTIGLFGGAVVAADIEVQVAGWAPLGTLRAALVAADQADWPERPLRLVESQTAALRFDEVPPGRYAVQLYQDSNGNGQLDLSPRGIPQEPTGFSGNPAQLRGKPALASAVFEHGSAPSQLNIVLRQPRRPAAAPPPVPAAQPAH